MTYITSFERIGREEGMAKGCEEGVLIGRILAYQEMLKKPLTPRQELERLSVEELTRLAEQLRQEGVGGSNEAGSNAAG